MYVPDQPRFSPRWLVSGRSTTPSWLADERWLPAGDRELYARASAGLYAALGRLDPPSGPALVPAYVPHAVVRAFRSRGYEVAYYPVAADLTLPTEAVTARIEAVEPAAVVFVDYFGFPDARLSDLAERARAVGATVVEDCARATFGRDRDGTPLGATGDLSIYSLHKTLPVPNGGLVVAPDLDLPTPDGRVSEGRDVLTCGVDGALSRLGVSPAALVGSSKPERSAATVRTAGDRSEAGFPVRGPGRATVRGLDRCDPARIQSRRVDAYRDLRRLVGGVAGVEPLTPPAHEGACPFGLAMRLPSRERRDTLYRRLRRRGVPIKVYQWPPLSAAAASDGAQTLRNRACVVPTHRRYPTEARRRLARALERAPE
jgi:dTDP-4-amino-4,6-dideoxygalactose transaminase